MAYSYTERNVFAKVFQSFQMSWMCLICLPSKWILMSNSYKSIKTKARANIGLQAAFSSIFPIESHSGNAQLQFVEYYLGEPEFDERECIMRGQLLRHLCV